MKGVRAKNSGYTKFEMKYKTLHFGQTAYTFTVNMSNMKRLQFKVYTVNRDYNKCNPTFLSEALS